MSRGACYAASPKRTIAVVVSELLFLQGADMTFPTYALAALLMLCAPTAFAQSTYSRDFNGNIVQKDQYGNILGTTSRDFNGNLVQKDQDFAQFRLVHIILRYLYPDFENL